MNPKQAPPPAPGMNLGDIYYILFRHKWLIGILSLVAVAAAILVYLLLPMPYRSEAKLLIKYVKESRPPEQTSPDSQVTSPDSRGANIINSEIEILTSFDLAEQVADAIGPAKILAKAGGGTNRLQAAGLIKASLLPEVAKQSDVITLQFSNPDRDLVQLILSQIIDAYLDKHKGVHAPEFNDFMTRQREIIRGQQLETEKQLHEIKDKVGIISLEDSKKNYSEMMAKIQQAIYDAEAERAGYRETIKEMEKALPKATATTSAPTNANPAADQLTPIPPDKVVDYQRTSQLLVTLQAKEQDLLASFTTNNSLVQAKQAEVAHADALKKGMEKDYPGLTAMRPAAVSGNTTLASPALDPRIALNEEILKADALGAKVQMLTNQLAQVRTNGALLTGNESTILQLQREEEVEDTDYAFYSKRLEEARANEAVGNSNISPVEAPTPPTRDLKKLYKATAGVFFGILAVAFGLPFLIELALDRSLKRPHEVQAKLGLPFFISIPQLDRAGKARRLKNKKEVALLADQSGETNGAGEVEQALAPQINGSVAYWDERHSLRPFYETLRDRLMTYFEMINLTHKPKLVGVTSCNAGAGVTSTAAGLASALSETGDGNVLLVNMTDRDGEAHHFYKGKLNHGLDEVLEKSTRGDSMVQDNLYVAREQPADQKLPRILPKRFSHLLPKMKASDFDYIIFDMPPVSQISITPRVARFMDMVLLVIESEKTDGGAARGAANMLSETKTNVGIVLNKSRSYVPRRLQHGL